MAESMTKDDVMTAYTEHIKAEREHTLISREDWELMHHIETEKQYEWWAMNAEMIGGVCI